MEGFDLREFEQFEKRLLKTAQERMPKEAKAFLRKEANKLKKVTAKKAKGDVKEKSGNLLKGIKVGRPYVYKKNGGLSIRVYGGKPAYHMHLVNYGHRIVGRDGKEKGFVQGKHFFEKAANEFQEAYYDDVYEFLDELLDKGLGGV